MNASNPFQSPPVTDDSKTSVSSTWPAVGQWLLLFVAVILFALASHQFCMAAQVRHDILLAPLTSHPESHLEALIIHPISGILLTSAGFLCLLSVRETFVFRRNARIASVEILDG